MIKRCQYVAYLSSEYASEDIDKAIISSDSEVVKKHISDKDCMTVALYRFRHMLFLYVENNLENTNLCKLFFANICEFWVQNRQNCAIWKTEYKSPGKSDTNRHAKYRLAKYSRLPVKIAESLPCCFIFYDIIF